MTLNEVAKRAHETAKAKGFWDGDAGDVCKKLLLIHAEVSEAVEEFRRGDTVRMQTELADVLIRTLDLMHYTTCSIEQTVRVKMDLNDNRPHMHGGKRF